MSAAFPMLPSTAEMALAAFRASPAPGIALGMIAVFVLVSLVWALVGRS